MKKLFALLLTLALLIAAVPMTTAHAQDDGIYVIADGVKYQVAQGEVIEYVYYFNTGEKLCSLDGEFFFDTAGLELIIPENEDGLEEQMIFPRLKYTVVSNQVKPGHIKFNFSSANGISSDKESHMLIRAQLRVTASAGEYDIHTALHTVAGANEKRYIYEDEVIVPLPRSEGGIPAKTPYDPDAPTQAPTLAPTEPPTQAPTPAPTEPPTQAPTPAPTEPPTQAPTPAPTEPPTQAPTPAPTQAPTPAPTEPPTQAPTPAPTEPPTQAPTPAPTEPPTQAPTPAPTEPPTQSSTDPPAEKYLCDEATGVKVMTAIDADLVVTVIQPKDFNYYLYESDNLTIYDVRLEKDGSPITLLQSVKVMIPAPDGAVLSRITHTTAQDMSVAALSTTYEDGYVCLDDSDLGALILAPDSTPVKAALYGDVDGDNELTVVDVSFIQRDLAGVASFDSDQQRIADVDGDGDATINDGTHIQRWLAGMSNKISRFGYPTT